MKVVDVNVLLYAVNEDAERHTVLRRWWEEALNGDESVGLPWIVLSGFLRVATNPRVFPAPMPVDRALAKVETWICAETVSVIVEKPAHWRVLRDLLPRTMQRSCPATAISPASAHCAGRTPCTPRSESPLGDGTRNVKREEADGCLAGGLTGDVRRIDPRIRIRFNLELDFPFFDANWNL